MARSFTTGSEPGRPRQTGQGWGFGAAPNVVRQPQNILVSVPRSTCVSIPKTGSYFCSASSYVTVVSSLNGKPLRLGEQRVPPPLGERRLDRRGHPVQPVVGQRRRHHLQADRQGGPRGEADRAGGRRAGRP